MNEFMTHDSKLAAALMLGIRKFPRVKPGYSLIEYVFTYGDNLKLPLSKTINDYADKKLVVNLRNFEWCQKCLAALTNTALQNGKEVHYVPGKQ